VTRGRHSLAPQKSKNRRLAFLAAPLVTSAVVGIGVAVSGSASNPTPDITRYASGDLAAALPAVDRSVPTSRDADRLAVTRLVSPKVTGRLWTTAALDLRATPTADAHVLGEVKAIKRLRVTGVRNDGFAQVVMGEGDTRSIAWVTAAYLASKKPTDPTKLPLSSQPCPDGSVENGLTAGAVKLYRAVCHAFPQVTEYGGWDAHGEHSSGKALDIMTSDVALGNAIADFLRAHASELNIYDVIWRQRIWTQERAAEGWRPMADRGSVTANHYDHVHSSVY
jgi:hypothetical protein